ncbi:MAG: acetoacetate decarboxylase family protein [bacterium]|nr:acetoacetate decarboxylase family protein [bacterium]
MNKKNDRFWNVEQTIYKTSEGDIEIPHFYNDFSQVLFFYFVKPEKLLPLLEGTDLKPCVCINNRAIVNLILLEYRDSSIGSYNEIGLSSLTYSTKLKKPFFVFPNFLKKGDKWKIAGYIHNLPVTSKLAYAAGVEIFGYPKFITEIPFSLTEKSFEATVCDPDSHSNIFSISCPIGYKSFGLKMPGVDLVTYSNNNKGDQLKAYICVDAKTKNNLFPSVKLTVGESNHVMAQNLRHLDLENKKPFSVSTTHTARGVGPNSAIV